MVERISSKLGLLLTEYSKYSFSINSKIFERKKRKKNLSAINSSDTELNCMLSQRNISSDRKENLKSFSYSEYVPADVQTKNETSFLKTISFAPRHTDHHQIGFNESCYIRYISKSKV